MDSRPTIHVPEPQGGWGFPWPNVAEIAGKLPHQKWTLVGGLMAQLHSAHQGIEVFRATHDVDMALHIETTRNVSSSAAEALARLGYEFRKPADLRRGKAHRFVRQKEPGREEVVDLLVSDHAAPRVREKLKGYEMMQMEGGTQALRRTVNASLTIDGTEILVSVPRPFGAVVLKAAAFLAENTGKERRHLQDATVLLAAVEDPIAERDGFTGSDRDRVRSLQRNLPPDSPCWNELPEHWRRRGQQALNILAADPPAALNPG